MDPKPVIYNPEEAEKAMKILERPPGVPYGHKDVSEVRKRESLSPSPTRLPQDKAWFLPGLLYVIVGLDKSIFELYHFESGVDLQPVTYRADNTLFTFDGVDPGSIKNPWFGTIQGIDMEYASDFVTFVSTALFKTKTDAWSINSVQSRLRDPFAAEATGVDCWFLMPVGHRTGRTFRFKTEAGLLLQTPTLEVYANKVPIQPSA